MAYRDDEHERAEVERLLEKQNRGELLTVAEQRTLGAAMAEWPVEKVEKITYPSVAEIAARGSIELEGPFLVRDDSGGESTYNNAYHAVCPKCAGVWLLDSRRRTITDDGMSHHPSILCWCGGHFWLTDGVLREV